MNHKLEVKSWNDSSLPLTTIQSLHSCNAILSYSVTSDQGNAYTITSVGRYGSATASDEGSKFYLKRWYENEPELSTSSDAVISSLHVQKNNGN